MSYRWSPAIGWGILAGIVIVFAVLFDLHAAITHGKTLSGQFHDWVFNATIGPIIFAVWVATFVGLTFHWFQYHGR